MTTTADALTASAISFTRPASLTPRTSASAQDEILRVAAFEAGLATADPADLDRLTADSLRGIAASIAYDVDTRRLNSYSV